MATKATCTDCGGTGKYRRGSYVNGKFIGFTGTCYRCAGKGHQTRDDVKRNSNYDNYYRRVE